ncbi:MAG: protein translocase subunit SecF [Acidobacteriia bacterium]|nr:protein translocase subunit SecF [Terriglobia bacterium]
MLQIFRNPKIDFMGKRSLWVGLSIAVVLGSAIVVPIHGIKMGIEFTGGTEVQVKYATSPNLGAIRSELDRAGFTNHLVTTIGKPEENEVYIRLGLVSAVKEENLTPKVVTALRAEDVRRRIESHGVDLNNADESSLKTLLESSPDLAREDAQKIAAGIVEARKEKAIFRSVDDLAGVPGMKPPAMEVLRQRAFTGPFAVRSESYIGPAIGRELVKKALLAILGSMVGMLAYIWFRFEFQWGLAAVVALVHDTAVSLLLFSLSGYEMSLPVVAAFLTLVGYSTNDTVVVFDRIRENLKLRGGEDLIGLINDSINQTLSRTIITSGLTWVVVVALLALGGEALRPFSFVMTIGIIVGTYSSIYIASPILVVWKHYFKKKGKFAATGARPGARKVRAS